MQKQITIIHLDDNAFELEKLKRALEASEWAKEARLESFSEPARFLERVAKSPAPDILCMDIDLDSKEQNGLNLTVKMRSMHPNSTIIMCSAMDDVRTIASCLNLGADDFISKKSESKELSQRIFNSYRISKLKRGEGELTAAPVGARKAPPIAGATLELIQKRIPRLLASAVTAIHIHGESGTGKEVTADLFASCLAASTPFVKVNCGAIAPTLLESELFGHVKGAFTGAGGDKRGFIEAASGGWIFLDEVASLSASAQVALLRAIENQEIIRVGDNTPRKINVKFISATNESLRELIAQGKFRQDLWQRLCEVQIDLPPLRERPAEIEQLVLNFCKHMPGGPYKISPPALEVLCSAPWCQGNIRELRNCLRAMTEFHVDKLLTPLAIPERIWETLGEKADTATKNFGGTASTAMGKNELYLSWKQSTGVDYDFLADVLLFELTKHHAQGSGKISLRSLAKLIGMSRSTLSTRLRGLVQRGIVELEVLSAMVGINDKPIPEA